MKLLNTYVIVGGTQLEILPSEEFYGKLEHRIPIFERWLIEVWLKGKLCDVMEITYDTEALAQTECLRLIDEQKNDNLKSLNDYEEKLKSFVMDETTEDREPPCPPQYAYEYIPKKYLCTMTKDNRYHTLIYEL